MCKYENVNGLFTFDGDDDMIRPSVLTRSALVATSGERERGHRPWPLVGLAISMSRVIAFDWGRQTNKHCASAFTST